MTKSNEDRLAEAYAVFKEARANFPGGDEQAELAGLKAALAAHEASNGEVSDAERVIADDLEVAPDVYVVKDENGDSIYCADYERACHEHINDAINEYGDLKARAWKVLRYRLMEMVPCHKCNSMRVAVPAPHDTDRKEKNDE